MSSAPEADKLDEDPNHRTAIEPVSTSTILDNMTNSLRRSQPSAASTFPYEVAEQILLQVPILDVLVAAAHLPPFWCDVIGNSKKISQQVSKLPIFRLSNEYVPKNRVVAVSTCSYKPLKHDSKKASRSKVAWTFGLKGSRGTLLVHRRADGGEALVVASVAPAGTLRVLSTTSDAPSTNQTRRVGYKFVGLYNRRRVLDFSKQLSKKVSMSCRVIWKRCMAVRRLNARIARRLGGWT